MTKDFVFTCSIDDGHPLDMKMAELLDKHGLNATFFVPLRNLEGSNVMSRAQLIEISRRFEIGSHTHDHYYLRNLDIRNTYHQIADGKKGLEDILGKEIAGFCYPGGKYLAKDIAMVKACGFKYARTTVNLCLGPGRNRFEMPTTLQFYPHDRAVYFRNFVKSGFWLRRSASLSLALGHRHWIRRVHALFDHAYARGTVFHLWGHSKQIDELRAWAELDAFFSHVTGKVGPGARLSNEQVALKVFGALA